MNTPQILLWSFPIGLSLHVFEEFGFPGGFRQWIKTYNPRKLKSNTIYFIENAAGILAVSIIALKANDILGYRIYLYCVAGMAGNAASHIRGTIKRSNIVPALFPACYCSCPSSLSAIGIFLAQAKWIWLPPQFAFVSAFSLDSIFLVWILEKRIARKYDHDA